MSHLSDYTFAVVDVETTGFAAGTHDRIVEIAVVQVDSSGEPRDEFVTLVNPERDIGATHIHGITASDVLHAPRFIDIAGDVAARLSGNVFVAHNARFDLSFVEAEFGRIGHPLPATATLCTMSLARRMISGPPSYRLGDLCEYAGIPLGDAHSALGDARATALLLARLLNEASARRWRTLSDLGCAVQPAPPAAWPRIRPSGTTHTRQHASG